MIDILGIRSPKNKKKTSVKTEPGTEKKSKGKSRAPAPEPAAATTTMVNVITCAAELYLWESTSEQFLEQGAVLAKIVKSSAGSFDYFMVASTAQGDVLGHKITSEMNPRWSGKLTSITWNSFSDVGGASSWLFRFNNTEDYNAFKQAYTMAAWEGLNGTSWTKIKVIASTCFSCCGYADGK